MILNTEKESKSLEKKDNGKVCQVTVLHLLHTELHSRLGLLVVTSTNMASMGLSARSGHSHRWLGKYGPTGGQRPSTHRIWLRLNIDWHGSEQAWPCPCICRKLWAQETCVVLHFLVSKSYMPQKNSWALHCFMAQFDHSSLGLQSLLLAQASFMGRFLLHVPC